MQPKNCKNMTLANHRKHKSLDKFAIVGKLNTRHEMKVPKFTQNLSPFKNVTLNQPVENLAESEEKYVNTISTDREFDS